MKNRLPHVQRAMFATLCLLTMTASLTAQTAPPISAAEKSAGENYHSSFASAEFAFGAREIMRGAPYSAIAEKETTQILSDGNRIVRRATAYIYRDSAGRTRYDRFFGSAPRGAVATRTRIIYDPIIGALFFFAPEKNIATKFPTARTSRPEEMAVTKPVPNASENLRSVVGDRTESLGTKIIEGVESEGARTTTSFAGSDNRPVTITYERWYARALGRNVLIKCTDTRFGEAVFRLTSVSRSEPAPELFTLPPANQIREITFRRAGMRN